MAGSEIPIRKVRGGVRRWLVDCRYVGGGREFFETLQEAEQVRAKRLAEVKQQGAMAFALSSDEKLNFVRVRERLVRIGASMDQAIGFFEANFRKCEPVTFSVAIQRCLKAKSNSNLDAVYIRKLAAHLLELMSQTGDVLLSQVQQEQIEGWLFQDKWSPATIRNRRIDVRTFFRFSFDRNWITANPAKHIPAIKIPDAAPGILSVEECRALLHGAKGTPALPFVALNLICGLRPEECVQLSSTQINIKRGYVEVPATIAKSRQRRIVELSKNAKAWLQIASGAIEPKNPKWYARQLPKLRKSASVILGRPLPWPKNCLRHSFASYHLAMHGSADKTATQLGHRSTDMLFRHYRELVTPSDAKKFWSILPTL